jgi:acetyl-CoA carboxylase carboxyltransferase component
MSQADWPELLADVRQATAAVLDEGRTAELARQRAAGKLTARERIAALADDGSFRESGALVGPSEETTKLTKNRPVPADGVITGQCTVQERPVNVLSVDFSVLGGSLGVSGMDKIQRLVERSVTAGIPLVMLLEGGGHRIQEGLDSRHFAHGARLFSVLPQLSGWVPVVAAILGPGFAGASNFAALADFVVMRRGTSQMGIAGPALVAAATGEVTDAETLGGAQVQADRNGIADLAVDSDVEALEAIADFLSYLPGNSQQAPPAHEPVTPSVTGSPMDVVPTNHRSAYDVLEVVDRIVDGSELFEIKPGYATSVVTGFARLGGRPVGIIANQPKSLAGALDTPACEKVAHFVSMCDAFGLALVYLIDVPGFLVGSAAEATGLARRSGRMVFELGQATVPRLSVVLRKGYGLAFVAMNGGRSFDADLAIAWPSAQISAMSIEGAVDVVFAKEVRAAPSPAEHREELIRHYKSKLGAVYAASGYGIDGVVEPEDTRAALIATLEHAPLRRVAIHPPRHHAISPI